MRYGTSYFVSRAAATRYYKDYGYDAAAVDQKIKAGEIHVGKPKYDPKKGERLFVVSGEGRWGIESPNPKRVAKKNPLKLFSFSRYYAECDGKKYGPFKTKAKARKVGAAIARVLMKPCRILGEAKNPCRKRKTRISKSRTRRRSTR